MTNDTAIESLRERIDNLNQQAWNIRVNDSPKAFELSKETVAISRNANYAKGLAEGLRTLGFCYIRLSRNEEAIPLFKESFSLFESLNDLEGQAVIYEYLSIIQRNRGDLGGSLELLLKALAINEENKFSENEGTNHYQLGVTYKHLGDFEKSLDHLYQSMSIWREIRNDLYVAYSINVIGAIYFETGDYKQALDYFLQGLVARRQGGDKWGEAGSLDNIGFTYLKLKDHEQAIEYCKQSLEITKSTGDKRGQANTLLHLAEIYEQLSDNQQAEKFSHESLEIRKAGDDKRGEVEVLLFLAGLDHKNRRVVLQYLENAIKIAEEIKANDLLSKARHLLYVQYKDDGDFKEALNQLELHIAIEAELHKNTINQKILNLEITHKAEEAKKEADAIRLRNEELTTLNQQIEEQKKKLEQTLADLKATQAQLIQSEKMASLGELTAGIAHEIQNPLNFVNNFSDVSNELLAEMKEELAAGNTQHAIDIADDVKENLEKVLHHGKRADAIVKSMLQHSRASSSKKEPTDINILTEEYLRLAYHGLRVKDKTFNAAFKTEFDSRVGKINVIPQDIGRVVLNLINNAFYAVNEKNIQIQKGYDPTVTITTRKINDCIELCVADNGNGIPQKVLDKIFQPFFTTKPTGQGTGLGLSLSYDIITKGHGGELKVNTKEGEGSEFIIQLPVQS
jgi:signal transduction histidine kinase